MLIPLLNLLFSTDGIPETVVQPTFSLSISYFSDLFNYYLGSFAAEKGKLYAMAFVCIVIASATLLANIFRYLSTRVLVRLKLNMLQRLRNHLYEKVSGQSMVWFNKNRKGDVISTMTNDVQEIEFSVISSFQTLLRDPFVIIAYFITLFYISPALTFFTILFFPISGLIIATLAKQLKKKGYFSQEMLGRILQHTDETISGIRVIQSFRAIGVFRERFQNINSQFTSNSKALFNQRELASPLSELLGVIVVVVVVMYGGNLVLKNELTGSLFITYLALYSQILQPAKNITSAISNMQKGFVSAERIFAILDESDAILDVNQAKEIQGFNSSIEFKNVGFAYGEKDVLSHINLTLKPGQSVALVGKSGSGKSTLSDLLLRFYDVTEGEILIDGLNMRSISIESLRKLTGLVNQDPIIFNDTVFNNITMGAENAQMDAVVDAAKHAFADDFIRELENGYDTILGDRGNRLSGGQKQRIAIARALFLNPPILILDEATSALDTESEKLVQDALSVLMENRTSLVIAHRLSTIRHCDEIIVLDQGKIIERGTHESLILANGLYKKLCDLQEFR